MVRARCLVCSRRSTAFPRVCWFCCSSLDAWHYALSRMAFRGELNVIPSARDSVAAQERADLAPECLKVDQECVVALDARERREARSNPRGLEEPGHRLLLVHREQQVRLHPDHQGMLEGRPPQERDRIAVCAEVEAVHGT